MNLLCLVELGQEQVGQQEVAEMVGSDAGLQVGALTYTRKTTCSRQFKHNSNSEKRQDKDERQPYLDKFSLVHHDASVVDQRVQG